MNHRNEDEQNLKTVWVIGIMFIVAMMLLLCNSCSVSTTEPEPQDCISNQYRECNLYIIHPDTVLVLDPVTECECKATCESDTNCNMWTWARELP